MNTWHIEFNQVLIGVSLSALVVGAQAPQVMAGSYRSSAGLSRSAKKEILDQHNQYRAAVNSPALEWSNALERDARKWAKYLKSLGGRKLVHASGKDRKGQGENIWMGTSGYFSPSKMVQTWGQEKKHFRRGIFPNVSKTGNWTSVGHYTQVVWKTTTKVGCAKTRAGGNDLLVCRYDPSGNVRGRSVL